jgi:chemotaxis protein methyltransferase CheR
LATASELERFRATIGRRIGLRFEDARLGFLDEVLQARLKERGIDRNAYLWALDCEPSGAEWTALARVLTVGETYFFRNSAQFAALAEVVLPERMRVAGDARTLRLLSAGCSSGEEAYSLAIVAREAVRDPSWTLSIRAVDLNPAALEKAVLGHYSSWALRETSIEARAKWFKESGRGVLLDEAMRATVSFAQANLAEDDASLWPPDTYDVVFCRNVLMYFEPEQMRAAIARIARALAPGGYLFLGHAETLRGVSDAFHLRNTHETFYYQRKDGAHENCARVIPFTPRQGQATPARAQTDTEWFDNIRQASERVAALVPMAAAEMPAPQTDGAFDAARALDLLRQERFAEALDHVQAGTQASRKPELLLLEAMLLAHCNKLAAADEAASRLLLMGEANAGAHYVLALCREHVGLAEHAAEHHRAAARHDPSFAMPHLHLGLLARRAGDPSRAQAEFSQAVDLLAREDAARLVLFGGGFSREALVALCQSALAECGGKP